MKIFLIKQSCRSFNLILSVILITFLTNYLSGQNEQYKIIGKVIDRNSLPVADTSILIEPVFHDPNLTEQLIEGVGSDIYGNFTIIKAKGKFNFGQKNFLYVSDGNMEGIETISAPFDWIRKYDKSFDGVPVKLGSKNHINLGNVYVKFWFETIKVDFSDYQAKYGKINWADIYLRIRNRKNRIVYFSTISTSDISQYVDNQNNQISISLPLGQWKIEILPPNSELNHSPIALSKYFLVRKGEKNELVLINSAKR